VVWVGNIWAVTNRENDATTTSTGGDPTCPAPSGTGAGGNHRSYCLITWQMRQPPRDPSAHTQAAAAPPAS
jgi:hypothetical protein